MFDMLCDANGIEHRLHRDKAHYCYLAMLIGRMAASGRRSAL
jgi:hypothetical protein